MKLVEGHLASYIGDGHDGNSLGSQGEVLSLASRSAYVKWLTGARQGEITLTDDDDLAPLPPARATRAMSPRHAYQVPPDELDDSLEVGTLSFVGVAQIQEQEGSVGLLNLLNTQGRLRNLAGAAQEALTVVAHRVRQEPAILEITAQLDEDAAEDLVQLTSISLLQSTFGGQPR